MSRRNRAALGTLLAWLAAAAALPGASVVTAGYPNSQKQLAYELPATPAPDAEVPAAPLPEAAPAPAPVETVAVTKKAPPQSRPGTFPATRRDFPVLRAAGWCAAAARTAVSYACFWEENGPSTDLFARRKACIPSAGVVPQRYASENKFDRNRVFGMADFERMKEAARKAKEAKLAAEGKAAEKTAENGGSEENPLPDSPGTPPRVVHAGANPDSTATSVSSRTIRVDPNVLLQYFDDREGIPDVRRDMRFVLPYQAEPPLRMDSSVTYTESGGAPAPAPSGAGTGNGGTSDTSGTGK
jgi:hypothetical protein